MKALELDDNNPVILNAIAGSECNLNNYKSASKYYGKAIESDSEFIQSYINFGRCYLTQKEYSKAIQILEQGKNNMISDSNMSKLDSLHNHSLFLNLGLSQEGMNNCKESFKNYRLSKSFACDNFSKKKVNYHVNKLKKSKKCH